METGARLIKGKNGEDVPVEGYRSVVDTREGDVWKIRVLTWNITPATGCARSDEIK